MSSPRNQLRTVADIPDTASSSRRKCSCPSRRLTAIRCAPFRRRVSFSDTAAFIGTVADHHCRRATIMQDDDPASSCHDNGRESESNSRERENFDYDIWQADDSSTGRSDDGYSESTPRIDNYAESRCVSGCTFDNGKSQRSHSEDIDGQTIESDGCRREEWGGESDVCSTIHMTENKKQKMRKVDEDDTVSNEDLSNHIHKDIDSIVDNEHRMRGGCGGCCCGARENIWKNYGCRCGGFVPESNESCASNANTKAACTVPSHCCCRPRVCMKTANGETPPCTTDIRSCGGGRCCGSRCREKPGQICIPSPRMCNSPAHSLRGRSPCASHRPLQSSCPSRDYCTGAFECARSSSQRCRSIIDNGCCDGTKCGTDVTCCRLRMQCECLGGGLDCRRCGRKVYQAEMQIVSGVPYHSICFSCFCCRKPLESLTYQENCGEIYCKQCYVRNFGPQGYGYGAGAGVLQTPL
ncbi:uncharacterized protein [Polyergus mexicanus]|uniref:uncharacterized protein n=1 Tax=Polyergus mexicanus TaxID=615972 RepID=UPI0038B5D29A